MTSTPYSLTSAWDAANRFIASTDGTILVTNTAAVDLRWAKTLDDTLPLLRPAQAHLIRPGHNMTLFLVLGARIWLAADPFGTAVIQDDFG